MKLVSAIALTLTSCSLFPPADENTGTRSVNVQITINQIIEGKGSTIKDRPNWQRKQDTHHRVSEIQPKSK